MSTVRIQVRRGTAAQWTSIDPVLEAGEIGFESDTNKFKFGNGTDDWSLLTYAAPGYTDFQNTLDDYLAVGLRGTANGVASLNSSGKVPASELDITELSQDAVNTAITAGTGITKTYDDNANTITVAVDTTAIQARVTDVSDTEIGYLNGVTSAIQTQLDDKSTASKTETLTNKVLTTPTINGPTITDTGQTPTIHGIYLPAPHTIIFEGTTANDFETTLAAGEPTADRTINLPDESGTVQLRVTNVTDTAIGYLNGVTSPIQTQIAGKAPIYSPTFTGTPEAPTATAGTNTTQIATTAFVKSEVDALISGAPGALNTLDELAAALGDDANYASTITTSLSGKLSLSGGTMTGDLSLAGSPTSNAHAANKLYVDGVASSASSTLTSHTNATTSVHGIADTAALATKTYADNTATSAASAAATDAVGTHNLDTTNVHGITDTAALVTTTQLDLKQDKVANVSNTEIEYLNGVTSSIQTQLDAKLASATAATTYAPIASPAFTGTVSGVTKAMVGLGDVDNTADSAKPVSTATQTALDLKSNIAGPTFTGTVTVPTLAVTTTATGITNTMVGLGNVDNTSDANKPVSTATQTALDAKASLAGATFTGNVEVDGNLVVDGDFTVNGTNFSASATTITIEDNLLQLAHQNAANTVDLGIVVGYNDGAAKHSGLVRDVSEDEWKLFKGVTTEPTTTVNFGQGSLDNLELNNLVAAGIVFTDGTQTKEGVASRTPIIQKTESYTLSALTERDSLIEVASGSATTITIPTNATIAYPVGTSIDILQTSTGQVTIAGAGGVTVNATPGLKLRTQWSSATLFKRATDTWIVMGDLSA